MSGFPNILESTASLWQASPLSHIDQTLSGLIRHTVIVNRWWCNAPPETTMRHTLTREVPVRTFTIIAMAFLFVCVGIQGVAHADEMKVAVEDMKGKANANVEKAKGEVKALTEEAKGNKVKGAMERAKGKTKAAGERIKGEAKELKAKTE